jgi:hypothetical protein
MIDDAVRAGVIAGEDCGERLVGCVPRAICVLKQHTLPSEIIDVGSRWRGVSIATYMIGPKGVDNDEDDIGIFFADAHDCLGLWSG